MMSLSMERMMKNTNQNLHRFMHIACEYGQVFNGEKCEVKQDSVTFFGTVYNADGAHPDHKKVDAVHQMPSPETPSQLQQFLGMVTYLSPFIPSLSTHTAPLQELLKKDSEFIWNTSYQEAFDKIKELVCKNTTSLLQCMEASHHPSQHIRKGTWSCTSPGRMSSCLCLKSSYPHRATIHQHRM